MSTDIEHLVSRLDGSLDVVFSPALGWLWPLLLRLLARGEPVTAEALREATGKSVEEVRAGLAALADTEYDEADRVVGHGIMLRPTPQSFEVDGRVVSIVTPDGCNSVRAAFCSQVHYFTSPAAAEAWLQEHPGVAVLPVREAFDLGHRLTDSLSAGRDHSPCC